jgi:hypothetical protein
MGEHGHMSTVFKRAIERGNVVAAELALRDRARSRRLWSAGSSGTSARHRVRRSRPSPWSPVSSRCLADLITSALHRRFEAWPEERIDSRRAGT